MLMARGVITARVAVFGGLTEAIAVTMRFGCLLDLPQYPNEGRAQADDDAQKQQRQTRGCEHGEHPSAYAKRHSSKRHPSKRRANKQRTSRRRPKNGPGTENTGAVRFFPAELIMNLN
jgi:hypothetical protein